MSVNKFSVASTITFQFLVTLITYFGTHSKPIEWLRIYGMNHYTLEIQVQKRKKIVALMQKF